MMGYVILFVAFAIFCLWLIAKASKHFRFNNTHVLTYMQLRTYYIIWRKQLGPYAYSEIQAKDPDDALYQFRCKFPGRKLVACSTDLVFINRRMNQLVKPFEGGIA